MRAVGQRPKSRHEPWVEYHNTIMKGTLTLNKFEKTQNEYKNDIARPCLFGPSNNKWQNVDVHSYYIMSVASLGRSMHDSCI